MGVMVVVVAAVNRLWLCGFDGGCAGGGGGCGCWDGSSSGCDDWLPAVVMFGYTTVLVVVVMPVIDPASSPRPNPF